MRTIFLLLLTIMIAHSDSNMIDKINQTLDQIQLQSSQRPSINLDIKYDPFYHDKKKITKSVTKSPSSTLIKKDKKSLRLSMIFNKKAFINGRWYKENQNVEQYMLHDINQNSVVLKRKNKTIILKLKTTENILVKKEVNQ